MNRLATAILVLLVSTSVMVVGTAILVADSDEGPATVGNPERYYISFNLDGGELPEWTCNWYYSGTYTPLPIPTKENKRFAGWYGEKQMTSPIGGILPTVRGNLILYAKWVDTDLSGRSFEYKVDGTYTNDSIVHRVTGTQTVSFGVSVDGYVLCETNNNIRYSWEETSFTDDTTRFSWVGDMTEGWRYVGNERMDGERIAIWQSDDTRMWLKDLMIPLKYETDLGNGKITQTMISESKYKSPKSFTPAVTAQYPIDVSGVPKTSDYGSKITLKASGDGFSGWYLNGVKVSDEREATFSMITASDHIVAASDLDYAVIGDSDELTKMGFRGATIKDLSGDVVNPARLPSGMYRASMTDGPLTRTVTFVVEGYSEFSTRWEYGGKTYTYEASIPYSEMIRDSFDNPLNPRFFTGAKGQVETYCSSQSETIRALARTLLAIGHDMSDVDYANFVLRFVQSIPYVEDIESRGEEEFWKYPLETLWDGCGDCEDTTFLYCVLMGLSGRHVAFVFFEHHTMPAIEGIDRGYMVRADGYRFSLCETTDKTMTMRVGDSAPGLTAKDAKYVWFLDSIPAL